ncbi:alpha-mannosidase [Streptomyces oceani]|uniref:alpha-mannosidase n=1 Tax=Streptomyces oceani TaxID=1075402 RepID=A0A1E7KJM4_9ACTN|nr:glycoside hydrolase family 38 C-terminal domain-containing protein [Streptomyces oceani]OEV04110.1 alpha-mannosidase [Streptomyces oceani]
MHNDRSVTEARLKRVLDERIRPACYAEAVPLEVGVWHAPGEPVPVAEGLAAEPSPIAVGDPWGAPWSTSWFTVSGTVPADWAGRTVEAVLDLGFDDNMPGFQCEGLVYEPDGTPVKGLNPRNTWVRIGSEVAGGERVRLHVEAAANPVILDYHPFLPTELGDRETAGDEPQYRLARMDLAVFDETVWELTQDLDVLGSLMAELSPDTPRRWEILRAVERCLDTVDLGDISGTAAAARERLTGVLTSPAHASAHRISAVGHAHIDSAWLWPLRETVRKVARTASNMTALLDDAPEFVYAMSQAQQFAWLKEHRPEVWARVKRAVADGRFVPVGGMWVESDTNMPGSEALARQFVHGKRFFLEEFGIETEEVWLPDTFGYSAALPQLVTQAGARWFLTQKISWSQQNKFPHHTFWWEGLDGTRVFTHFPPIDSYNAQLSGAEVAHAVRNFQEKGGATRSLAPTGWGDGGGGTTREMLARARRLADLEGSARVSFEKPAEFFTKAEEEYAHAPVWAGELYLELHRATLTSQARTKQGNRHSERLLYEAELWAATAAVRSAPGRPYAYPHEALDRLWKTVLLHQFHDILPGTSIAWVHREAARTYAEVAAELEAIIREAQATLAGDAPAGGELVFNAAPHARSQVPAGGARPVSHTAEPTRRDVAAEGGFVLDNGLLRVVVDAAGLVRSVYDTVADRETLAPGQPANLLQLHQDFPNMWDAWDVDHFYRNTVTDLTEAESVTAADQAEADAAGNTSADGASVRVTRRFGSSRVEQVLTLPAGERRLEVATEVDWHETEKFLKLAFPLDVHTDRIAAETQFGHLHRPTHTNTSWDAAKFEACQHRFVHLTEPGWGVALVNDSTYGYDVSRTPGEAGALAETCTATTVRLSLLRAPRFPDPRTDQGVHRFRCALVPGATIGDAVREGHHLNLPERRLPGDSAVPPLVSADEDAVVITAVKLADDGSTDVVVRLHEAHGGRVRTRLTAGFPLASATRCDLLERPTAEVVTESTDAGEVIPLSLRPFEITTLRLRRRED